MIINDDAFSSGQIGSKVWLCRHLERYLSSQHNYSGAGNVIWIYGGWVGLLPFLLCSREKIRIDRIISFDPSEESLKISEKINNTWHWKGVYRPIKEDSKNLDYGRLLVKYDEPAPHVVINTAPELMADNLWFSSIPTKKMIAIQSSNIEREGIKPYHSSLRELKDAFPLSEPLYGDKLHFDYGNGNSFYRFMVMGYK